MRTSMSGSLVTRSSAGQRLGWCRSAGPVFCPGRRTCCGCACAGSRAKTKGEDARHCFCIYGRLRITCASTVQVQRAVMPSTPLSLHSHGPRGPIVAFQTDPIRGAWLWTLLQASLLDGPLASNVSTLLDCAATGAVRLHKAAAAADMVARVEWRMLVSHWRWPTLKPESSGYRLSEAMRTGASGSGFLPRTA
jgi:hypothetical protein